MILKSSIEVKIRRENNDASKSKNEDDPDLHTLSAVVRDSFETRVDTVNVLKEANSEAQHLKLLDRRVTVSGAIFAIVGALSGLTGACLALSEKPGTGWAVFAAICAFIAVILKAVAKLYLSKKEKKVILGIKSQLEEEMNRNEGLKEQVNRIKITNKYGNKRFIVEILYGGYKFYNDITEAMEWPDLGQWLIDKLPDLNSVLESADLDVSLQEILLGAGQSSSAEAGVESAKEAGSAASKAKEAAIGGSLVALDLSPFIMSLISTLNLDRAVEPIYLETRRRRKRFIEYYEYYSNVSVVVAGVFAILCSVGCIIWNLIVIVRKVREESKVSKGIKRVMDSLQAPLIKQKEEN